MNGKEITKLLDEYISNEKQQGCFLIKGAWGVGKTHFIKDYVRDSKACEQKTKFIIVSLFDKKDTAQIAAEINSKLISSRKKFLKKLLKTLTGVSVLSAGIEFDLTSLVSEKNQLEKNDALKDRIVFIFDDLERTSIDLHDALGYINNINENYGFKVVVLANTDEISEEKDVAFKKHREKIFYTKVLFSDNFSMTAGNIISKSNLGIEYKDQIIEAFSSEAHNNLRTLIFAIQKIEQVLASIKDPLDEYVLISLIRTIIKYSIVRTEIPNAESNKERAFHESREFKKAQVSIYGMGFLEAFVNNEEYSFDEIIKNIQSIQQYAIKNKDNPLPRLKEEWVHADDEEYWKIMEDIKTWIKDNKITISEYPNILKTIGNEFFVEKLSIFCNADEYISQIFEFMKKNICKADLDELNSSRYDSFDIWPERDYKEYIKQLKMEIDTLREKKIEQAFDCDVLFDNNRFDIYKRREELAIRGKDILEVCSPEMIVDRIKRENDLHSIDKVRGVLLDFYRSDYPINTSKEERLRKLKENEKVKVLLDALNEYLKQEDMSKSKRFLLETMIKNLNGTHFL